MEITHPLPLDLNVLEVGEYVQDLGSGTYGSVKLYKYKDEDYAVKTWKSEMEDYYSTSALREISCTIRLSHPNIIQIKAANVTKDYTTMAMPVAETTVREYLELSYEGRSKILRISQYGSPVEDKKDISYQFLCAVDYCHSRNVLHRDLKPDNILVMSDGMIKLADFGLARGLSCVEGTGKTNLVTTIWYRAPEIIFNGNYDEGADKWSVGCILYEIFRGVTLFKTFEESHQVQAYCQRLGPYPDEIYSNYPNWGSFKEQNKSCPYVIREDIFTEIPDTTMRNFILSLLEYDQIKRPKLRTIIKDPYFDSVRNTESENYKWYGCIDNLSLRAYPIIKLNNPSLNSGTIKVIHNIMLDINRDFQLSPRTYFYALYLLSKIVNVQTVGPTNILGVANSCMFISSLYNEINTIVVEDLARMNSRTEREVTNKRISMNKTIVYILNYLHFDLLVAVCYDFFSEYSRFYSKRDRNIGLSFLYVLSMTRIYYLLTPKDLALLAILCQCVYTQTRFKNVGNIDVLSDYYVEFIEILMDERDPDLIQIYEDIFLMARIRRRTIVEKLKEGPILV